jgi:anti-sigma regulatory factor (Ser/Thr protein kinase)
VAADSIRGAIRELLAEQDSFTGGELARRLGVTRQAVHRTLQRLVAERSLVLEGAGRGARYRAAISGASRTFDTKGLEEHVVWEEMARAEPLQSARGNALAILRYALTEMVNNAIEHSGSDRVMVRTGLDGDRRLTFDVVDRGVGVFERVRRGLGLVKPIEALQELSKGKVTTMPLQHTGEGIFFVTKCGDAVEIASGGLRWQVDNVRGDQAIATAKPARRGTRVHFAIAKNTRRRLKDLFDTYTHDLEFDTTRIVVKLFELGTSFVSRSEGKRLTQRLERFREAILDFSGVESVGQGFADEVFRVWAQAHPETRLVPIDMDETVEFMVRRALARTG